MEYINQNGKIAIGDISKMFEITRQAALKEVSKLVDLDVVKLRGKGCPLCIGVKPVVI